MQRKAEAATPPQRFTSTNSVGLTAEPTSFDPHGLGWPDRLSPLSVYVTQFPSVSFDRMMTGTTIT